jgi:transcriptional regulator with XRE-family HTH domain
MALLGQTIGQRLRVWREFSSFGQKEASKVLMVHHKTYQNYESDISSPGYNELIFLINIGINANWLLTGKGEMLLADAELADPVEPAIAKKDLPDSLLMIANGELYLCSLAKVKDSQ